MMSPIVLSHLVEFSDRWNSKAYNAGFWAENCAEVFTEIINDASAVLLNADIKPDDEVLFNIFQLVTLNFALAASLQPNMRKFAGIKKACSLSITTWIVLTHPYMPQVLRHTPRNV